MLSRAQLAGRVARLLEENRVEDGGHRYTRPARRTYPHQWLWDSCFHAMLWTDLGEPARAAAELRALFRAQEQEGRDAGRVPHMTFLSAASAQDPDAARAHARDVALWGNPRASTISQPPIVAEALARLPDHALWRELWTPLCAYYDWWLRRRDPDGERLVSLWHLWECGADATPRGDPACARLLAGGREPRHLASRTVNPTASKSPELLGARFLMLEELQSLDAREAGGELEEERAQRGRQALLGLQAVDMQAYLVRNLLELARIGEAIGQPAAARYRAAAAAICEAVNEALWDEEAGFYFDRWGAEKERVPVSTTAPLIALYAGELVPFERAERLLGHLIDPDRFWTRWPVPSVARSEPCFTPDEYWRGSTWVSHNWLIVRGLLACAARFADRRFLPPARGIAERTVALVEELGFREYYRSGSKGAAGDRELAPAGFGPEGFGWSGLALELHELLDGPLADVEAQR